MNLIEKNTRGIMRNNMKKCNGDDNDDDDK